LKWAEIKTKLRNDPQKSAFIPTAEIIDLIGDELIVTKNPQKQKVLQNLLTLFQY